MSELYNCLMIALQQGDAVKTQNFVKRLLEKGYDEEKILNEALIESMNLVAKKFKKKEIFLPDILLTTRAFNAGISVLEPRLKKPVSTPVCKILLGTVEGDLHDIGKNLVKILLERESFEVIDLGNNVPKEKFVEAIKEYNPQVLGLSAALTTTMYGIRDVIEEVKKAGLRDKVLIMAGGVPITESFAIGIGADIYDTDGSQLGAKIREKLKDLELVNKKQKYRRV